MNAHIRTNKCRRVCLVIPLKCEDGESDIGYVFGHRVMNSVARLEVEYGLGNFQPDVAKIMQEEHQHPHVDKPVW